MIKVSIPGKIHLMGEHVVVYGKPALLAGVNLRLEVIIGDLKSKLKQQEIENFELLKGTVERVIKDKFKLKKIPEYKININSQILIGSKLGSSAAVSAAYIAALLSFLKIKWDKNSVNELTYEAEKVFHGNPSGGDNSSVVFGGLLWFRKEFEFLKSITPLNIKVHKNIKKFVLINSGRPLENTKEMIELVKNKREKSRKKIDAIFNDQEEVTKRVLNDLISGDEKQLMVDIKEGEKNLEKLGVVGKKAKGIIREVEKLSGAAKIIGGGGVKDGSGMLLCYNPKPDKTMAFAKVRKLEALKIKLGEEGLRRE